MTFYERLEQLADTLEQKLGEILTFEKIGCFAPESLAEAIRYSTLGGGKRIRPFLVVESARIFEVPDDVSIVTAAAIECMHCYSLVHDDLPSMDDDDMRRGKPSVHIAFNEATAVLVGDALQSLAFEILADPAAHPIESVRIQLVSGLAKAAGPAGMAGGQMLDLRAEVEHIETEEDIQTLQSMKTGALIRFSCEAGAILGQADEADRQALRSYADKLGLAFQIADDLLDFEGDGDLVGKATGKDAKAGKATLVSVLGPENARLKLNQLQMEAVKDLERFEGRASALIEVADFIVQRQH